MKQWQVRCRHAKPERGFLLLKQELLPHYPWAIRPISLKTQLSASGIQRLTSGSAAGSGAGRPNGSAIPWSGASKRRASCNDLPLGAGMELKKRFNTAGCGAAASAGLVWAALAGALLLGTPEAALAVAPGLVLDDALALAVVLVPETTGAGAAADGRCSPGKSISTIPVEVRLIMLSRRSASDCEGSAAAAENAAMPPANTQNQSEVR